jgi:hypothetical protein
VHRRIGCSPLTVNRRQQDRAPRPAAARL